MERGGGGVSGWGGDFALGDEVIEIETSDELLMYDVEVFGFFGEFLFEGGDACFGGGGVVEEARFEGVEGREFVF